MIQYGLDPEYANKVFVNKSRATDALEDLQFSSYALVGLSNFFRHHPEKYRSRLSKGPPPAYRWLAWKFSASLVIVKEKGLYEVKLYEGEAG